MKNFKYFVLTKLSIIGLLLSLVISHNAFAADVIEFWDARDEESTQVVDHSQWQEILNTYLNDEDPSGVNRFDYKSVSSEDSEHLQSQSPRQLNSQEQFAFWVNLYNAKTVDYIIDGVQEDDITSIKQIRSKLVIPGPWKRKDLKIEGEKLSLDSIEHGILRPIWKDHRIHYAVNCASIGCPNLLKTAYTVENTEELLEIAEEDFLTHPRAAHVDGETVVLSSLFDWYGPDFASSQTEFFEYLSDFVEPEIADLLLDEPKVKYDYDWKLNAQ